MARKRFSDEDILNLLRQTDLELSSGNTTRSKMRAHIEHVFATQKQRMGLFIRTIEIDRARTKIGMANLVCNYKRTFWLDRRCGPI